MDAIRISCINKTPRNDTHEGITHVGGAGWRKTRQEVINLIKNHTNTYYTLEGGKRAEVAVMKGANGEYLRTHADGKPTDNLLSLSECPFI